MTGRPAFRPCRAQDLRLARPCGSDRNRVPALNGLDQLHADYATLALRPPGALSPGRRRSLLFYRGELALLTHTPTPPQTPILVIRWLQTLAALEAFISRETRWPRENRRLDRAAITAEERRLAIWVRTQRTAADGGVRCDYQLRRLACVPGFHRHPLDDRWYQHVIDHQHFTDTQRRAPLLRSDDSAERSLAAFAAKQRLAYRQGQLLPRRIEILERLPYFTWARNHPSVKPPRGGGPCDECAGRRW